MTQQDYVIIAAAIKEALESYNQEHQSQMRIGMQVAANRISRNLQQDNSRFDRNQFLRACGL
jgi:seryl-tRNA(Sec) selenium transferase